MKYVMIHVVSLSRFIHQRFIWFLLVGYIVAAIWPACGLGIRSVILGRVEAFHEQVSFSLSMLMLAFLLFNAGLGVEMAGLRELPHNMKLLLIGLAANVLVPLGFIFLVSRGMGIWHNSDVTQTILVGLALVASMPIAGSSTAWSRNSNGDGNFAAGFLGQSTNCGCHAISQADQFARFAALDLLERFHFSAAGHPASRRGFPDSHARHFRQSVYLGVFLRLVDWPPAESRPGATDGTHVRLGNE